jgi:hypothetical protein
MSKKKQTPAPNSEFRDWDFVPAEEPAQELPTTHTMAEGENILTVARLYLPEGMTRSEYANKLVKTNPSFAVDRIINLV